MENEERPWDSDRALRVTLYEFYSNAHESWANVNARKSVEGVVPFERPNTVAQYRKSKE